jgi:hypothetical protein
MEECIQGFRASYRLTRNRSWSSLPKRLAPREVPVSRVSPDALGGGRQRAQRLHQEEDTCGAWPRNYQNKEWRGPPDPEHGDAYTRPEMASRAPAQVPKTSAHVDV